MKDDINSYHNTKRICNKAKNKRGPNELTNMQGNHAKCIKLSAVQLSV